MSGLGHEVHRSLKANQLRPNQRLGQHFLVSDGIAERILTAAELSPGDTVLEIGCGVGALTRRIKERVARVVAVDIDRGLAEAARVACADLPGVEIFHQDILEMDLKASVQGPCQVISNLPYYLTAPILEWLIEGKRRGTAFSRGVVMVQEEVADRMLAQPGQKIYGSFTVYTQYWLEISRVCRVAPGSFFPAPDVGSVVLAIRFRDQPAVPVRDPEVYFEVVRMAFRQRRKMLRQSLLPLWSEKPSSGELEEVFKRAQIPPTWRPEQVDLEGFGRLADAVVEGRARHVE